MSIYFQPSKDHNMDSSSLYDEEDDFEPDVEPLQELSSDVKVSIQNLPKELEELPDVKQFAEYINKHLVLGKEEYTAKNWQEFVVEDNRRLLCFGRPGAWYQYIMQQRARIIVDDELQKSNLAPYAEIANVWLLHRGITVDEVNWGDIVESFDCDPPYFNQTQLQLELKINVPHRGYILLLLIVDKYERYRSATDKTGDNAMLAIWIIESTIAEFESLNRSLVADNDEFDYEDYYDPTTPLAITLNAEFFTALASLLEMERETLFSSLLNIVHYPFLEVDWNDSWEDVKEDNLPRPTSYEHIRDEINSKVSLTLNLFESGYLDLKEHVRVLDYLALLIHKKVINEHAKTMTLLSIKEESYDDYSAATELISKRTYWHSVSESFSWYEMDIVDAQGNHECSIHMKFMIASKYSFNYDGDRMVIIITNVADETLQKQISETFEQWERPVSTKNKNKELNEFSFRMSFLTEERDGLLLRALANLMHFNDWKVVGLWRFLLDVTTLDERGIDDQDLFVNSYDTDCDDYTSDSVVSETEAMALDEEVNEINMSVEITSQNGRPKRTKKPEPSTK